MNNIKLWIKANPHCWLLTYWILYLIYFALLERFAVPTYMIYSPLDDFIPFNEWFIIPYLLWFPLLAGSLAYFLFHNKKAFQDLCFLMFTGMSIALLIYTFFPNGLALRVSITSDNVLASIVKALQSFDTPTNVCPSIHVSSTLAILFVTLRYTKFQHPLCVKTITTLLSLLIVLSTMFLKQHSIIDVAAGAALSGALYVVTYHFNWRRCCAIRPLSLLFS